MSDTSDDPTDADEAIETESAADFAPPSPEDAAPVAAGRVETVTRKGAAIGMAGCLVVGGLLGWGVGAATSDDDAQPVSFQGGRFPGEDGRGEGGGELHGEGHWYPGPMGPWGPWGHGGDFPGGGFPGGPGDGFPGGPGGGGFEDHRGYPPGYDEDGDQRGDERGQDEDDDETPSTTTEG
jgi:hypothetical protein